MPKGEGRRQTEVHEAAPEFQYAEIRFGGPSHPHEYTMHVGGYDHEKYIPDFVEARMIEQLPAYQVSNRGTRIEIHGLPLSGKGHERKRDDVAVYAAANVALRKFSESRGSIPYKLAPYGWDIAQEFIAKEYGGEMASRLPEIAIYEVAEGSDEEKAQKVYDLVEGFYGLVSAARSEDGKPLEGETQEERTQRNKQNLKEVLDEIESARGVSS